MYPFLYQGDGISIPSYFVVISLAFVLGQIWLVRRAQSLHLSPARALDLGLIIMLGGFIGARVMHIVYEYPRHYLENPWRVFAIWQGGFVFFGGALLAYGCCRLYLHFKHLDPGPWADLFAPIIPVVYGLGRVGSFLSGSCFGTPTHLPWGVIYPPGVEAPMGVALHPATLYEAVWSWLCAITLLALEKKRVSWLQSSGALFAVMLILHGIGRIGLEQLRGDYRGALILGQTVSTWLSLLVILYGLRSWLELRSQSLVSSPSPRTK